MIKKSKSQKAIEQLRANDPMLRKLRRIEDQLGMLTRRLLMIIHEIELPKILDIVRDHQAKNPKFKLTTEWLQDRFRMGYSRAARVIDAIEVDAKKHRRQSASRSRIHNTA